MRHLLFALTLVFAFTASATHADQGSNNIPNIKQCNDATRQLAKLQADEDKPWSLQKEAETYLKTWSHDVCKQHRSKAAFDVRPEMDQIMARLEKAGLQIDAAMALERDECIEREGRIWRSETDEFRRKYTLEGLIERCVENSRIKLYAQEISRKNAVIAAQKAEYEEQQAEYKSRKAEYQSEKAKLDRKRKQWLKEQEIWKANHEKWKERDRRCRAGEYEYCSEE